MSVKERLKTYLKHKGVNASEFGRTIGVSSAFISSMRVSIQPDKVESIAFSYPDLNIEWLLTGKGDMLNNSNKTENVVSEPQKDYSSKKDHIYETINNLSASSNRDSINIAELIETTKKMADTAERNSRTLEKLVDMIKENGLNVPDYIEAQKGATYTTGKSKAELTGKKTTDK